MLLSAIAVISVIGGILWAEVTGEVMMARGLLRVAFPPAGTAFLSSAGSLCFLAFLKALIQVAPV